LRERGRHTVRHDDIIHLFFFIKYGKENKNLEALTEATELNTNFYVPTCIQKYAVRNMHV
jgi:hypothetical protein